MTGRSKRLAADQITRETYREDDNSDGDDGAVFAKRASSEVMAKRKIIMPKGRGVKSFNPPTSTLPNNSASNGVNDTKSHKIKALNQTFIQAITSANLPNSVANFVPLAEKYIQYYNQIQNGSLQADTSSTVVPPKVTLTIPTATTFPPIPTSTPTLSSMNETSKPNPFAFLKNKNEKNESAASNNAVPKPSFSFGNTSSTSTATSVSKPFSFASKDTTIPQQPKVPISFGNATLPTFTQNIPEPAKPTPTETAKKAPAVVPDNSESDSDSDEEIKIQGPTFSLTSKPVVKNSPFSFGPKPAKKVDSDSDSESEVEIKGPTFTFNKQIKDNVFKFKPTENKSEKPFTFGKVEEKADEKKNEAKNIDDKESKEEPKPTFSFSTDKKPETPSSGFSFGKPATDNNGGKSAFSFDSSNQKEPQVQGFSFGSNVSTKPAFSFGSNSSFGKTDGSIATTETKEDVSTEKPTFSFNSTDKPAFSFGTSTKPSFTFGKSDNLNSGDSNAKENAFPSFGSKPAISFNFGAKSEPNGKEDTNKSADDKPKFQFSFNPPANNSTTVDSNTNDEDDKMPEEETGGDFKPVVQLTGKVEATTGEENEDVLYSKRTKLMLFDKTKEQPYVNKGLGDLKVLKQKDTGKSRILVRADGGLRVLLNSAISKDISYSSLGDGSMVRVPTVNPTTNAIETYVLKVKTPKDGEDLLSSIEAGKN